MGQHVVVIGAGAFGGWTALALLRAGCRVTLVDAWGPGNSRASSGGETRLIRGIYGGDPTYIEWVADAFDGWRAFQAQVGEQVYFPTEALWMFHDDDTYATSSLPHLERVGLKVQCLTPQEGAKRFPIIRFDDISTVYVEEEAGYLMARRACELVWQQFIKEGGEVVRAWAKPGPFSHNRMEHVVLDNGDTLTADAFVFACGPWLGEVFASVIGERVLPTRQDIYYFGLPKGASAYAELPVWMDYGERILYGVPDGAFRGFKAGDDTRGAGIDPSTLQRQPDLEGAEVIRKHLSWRFPGLQDLPLVESRVCQYENSPDGQLIIDRHPEASNVRLLGGGSGHGFKLGPALGPYMAGHITADTDADARFSLKRFSERNGLRHTQFNKG